MIVRDMYVALKYGISEWYREMFQENKQNSKYLNYVLALAIAGSVVWGGYKLYNYYIHSREASAQKVLNECVAELNKAKGGMGSWYDVEVAFDMAHQQNSGSQLAPFFLAFKAEAEYNQGKVKEAIATLSKSLDNMGQTSDFFGLYNVKRALMKLDAKDDALQQQGLQELQAASQKNDSGQGVALFHLGSYYWDKNDFAKAKEPWKKLVALYDEKDGTLSQYAQLAKERLKQID